MRMLRHDAGGGWETIHSHLEWPYSLTTYKVGLHQLCSKICLKCFWEFPKNFPYYAQTPYVKGS